MHLILFEYLQKMDGTFYQDVKRVLHNNLNLAWNGSKIMI
jgi:hypothetical protein